MYILSAERDADPRGSGERYSAYLRENEARFPPGALKLARSEWYFNFSEHWCPHDGWLECLRIEEPSSGERQEVRSVSITVRLLAAYHDGYIELRYPKVFGYRLASNTLDRGHHDWRYDEFRVTADGLLEHEIEWAGFREDSSWIITASDIEYSWIPR